MAMSAAGFRAVVAESFGDIFVNNCLKNGLLPVQLAASVVIVVPLDAQSTGPGVEPFKIKLPLEKTLAELVNTAVNMVAAAMVGTRMNQRVPSPTVAKMRNG